MKNEYKLMVPQRNAIRIFTVFFTLGSLLFIAQLILGDFVPLAIIGLIYIGIALLFNGIAFLLALIDLIKKDRLESFYSLLLLLLNLPVAAGYAYVLLDMNL